MGIKKNKEYLSCLKLLHLNALKVWCIVFSLITLFIFSFLFLLYLLKNKIVKINSEHVWTIRPCLGRAIFDFIFSFKFLGFWNAPTSNSHTNSIGANVKKMGIFSKTNKTCVTNKWLAIIASNHSQSWG